MLILTNFIPFIVWFISLCVCIATTAQLTTNILWSHISPHNQPTGPLHIAILIISFISTVITSLLFGMTIFTLTLIAILVTALMGLRPSLSQTL